MYIKAVHISCVYKNCRRASLFFCRDAESLHVYIFFVKKKEKKRSRETKPDGLLALP